ncbi:MAG: hypothetical protein G01um101444_371 [Parcubacteria group bacterium Gr01-1014_44]|nr:MAG: hypothetical protein G01um101444_371 [Parcubacteria group bacterium Gr01-1014_44]
MIRKVAFLCILIFSFLISGCASRRVYFIHSYSHGFFQVSYPKTLFIVGNDGESFTVSSSPLEKYANGGLPPGGTVNITIFHVGESGSCGNPSSFFEPFTLDNEILYFSKTVCLPAHFIAVLEIWDSKLDKEKEELLENILKSFKSAAK